VLSDLFVFEVVVAVGVTIIFTLFFLVSIIYMASGFIYLVTFD
jgi:hypothetical protein